MKRAQLYALLLSCLVTSLAMPLRRAAAREPITIQQAVDLAIKALHDRPASWRQGCDIRVRPGKGDWSVNFEPIPMGPGLDVMVIVHSDGSTTVAPGY